MRGLVFEPVAVDRGISRVRVEMRRFDDPDLGPGRQLRRGDIMPSARHYRRCARSARRQCRPRSARPSQARGRCRKRRPSAVPRWNCPSPSPGRGSRGTPGVGRVRSGLIGAQVCPPLSVRQIRWLAKNSACSRLLQVSGRVQVRAVIVGEGERRIDTADLTRLEVEPVDTAAIDDVRIERIGRDFVAFAAGGDSRGTQSC